MTAPHEPMTVGRLLVELTWLVAAFPETVNQPVQLSDMEPDDGDGLLTHVESDFFVDHDRTVKVVSLMSWPSRKDTSNG